MCSKIPWHAASLELQDLLSVLCSRVCSAIPASEGVQCVPGVQQAVCLTQH